jgi:hypothetical protein
VVKVAQQNHSMFKLVSRHAQWIIAVFGFWVFGLTQTQWLTNCVLWQTANGALIDQCYYFKPNVALRLFVNAGVRTSNDSVANYGNFSAGADLTLVPRF